MTATEDKAPTVVEGENLLGSHLGCSVIPPAGWEDALRALSPITNKFSHLRFYWYRAKMRWVLYDCVPGCLIREDQNQGAPILGSELLHALEGPAPRDLQEWDRTPYVSDVQHEFYRLFQVYARPFWVLQGSAGGHQIKFSPWQANTLIAKGLPAEPPEIGSLPPCPFDGRVTGKLNHLNRLRQLGDSLERLQKSASKEAADKEMEGIQREIRLAESRFIEEQMEPIVEMSTSLVRGANTRSEHDDQLVRVRPGQAARASDAYDQYLETGDWSLGNITGH